MRESELAMGIFNKVPWPETGRFALGASNEDHRLFRPYMAKMFDSSRGKGWDLNWLKKEFRTKFAKVNRIENNNQAGDRGKHELFGQGGRSKTIITWWVIEIMHKMALDMEITEDEAYELTALQ